MQKKLMTFALLTLSQGVFAAQFPDSGSQLQQIPPSPTLEKAQPEIKVEQAQVPAIPAADNVKIVVNSLNLTGNSLYSEAKLLAVTDFVAGK